MTNGMRQPKSFICSPVRTAVSTSPVSEPSTVPIMIVMG